MDFDVFCKHGYLWSDYPQLNGHKLVQKMDSGFYENNSSLETESHNQQDKSDFSTVRSTSLLDFINYNDGYSVSSSSVKPTISSFTEVSSSFSSEQIFRQRRHRNHCIACIAVLIFSVIAICIALVMVFITQRGDVITYLHLKMVNVGFHPEMKNRTSKQFRGISVPFCREINRYFKSSYLADIHQTCSVENIRNSQGCVAIDFQLLFKDDRRLSSANQVRDIIVTKSGRQLVDRRIYLRIHRFLVPYKSLHVHFVKTGSTVPGVFPKEEETRPDSSSPNISVSKSDTTWIYKTNRADPDKDVSSVLSTVNGDRINSVTIYEMPSMAVHRSNSTTAPVQSVTTTVSINMMAPSSGSSAIKEKIENSTHVSPDVTSSSLNISAATTPRIDKKAAFDNNSTEHDLGDKARDSYRTSLSDIVSTVNVSLDKNLRMYSGKGPTPGPSSDQVAGSSATVSDKGITRPSTSRSYGLGSGRETFTNGAIAGSSNITTGTNSSGSIVEDNSNILLVNNNGGLKISNNNGTPHSDIDKGYGNNDTIVVNSTTSSNTSNNTSGQDVVSEPVDVSHNNHSISTNIKLDRKNDTSRTFVTRHGVNRTVFVGTTKSMYGSTKNPMVVKTGISIKPSGSGWLAIPVRYPPISTRKNNTTNNNTNKTNNMNGTQSAIFDAGQMANVNRTYEELSENVNSSKIGVGSKTLATTESVDMMNPSGSQWRSDQFVDITSPTPGVNGKNGTLNLTKSLTDDLESTLVLYASLNSVTTQALNTSVGTPSIKATPSFRDDIISNGTTTSSYDGNLDTRVSNVSFDISKNQSNDGVNFPDSISVTSILINTGNALFNNITLYATTVLINATKHMYPTVPDVTADNKKYNSTTTTTTTTATTSSNKSPAVTMGINTSVETPNIKATPSFRDDIISNGTSTGSYDGNLDTRVSNVSFDIGKNQSNDGVNFYDSVSVTSPLINTGNALFNNITLYATTVLINATKHMNPTVPDVTADNKKYNSTTTTTTTSSNKSPAVTMGISTDDALVTPSIKATPSFRYDIISNGTSTGSYDGNLDTRVSNVSFDIGKNQSNDGVNFYDSVSVTSPLINTGNALFNNITLYATTVLINATKHMNPTVPDVTADNKKYNSTTTTTTTSSNKSPAVTMGISTDDALVTPSIKATPSFRYDIISNGTSTGSYDGNLDTRVSNVSFDIGKNQSNDGVNFPDSVSVTSPLINTENALFNNITLYATIVLINATKHMNPTVPDVTADNKKYNSTTTTTTTTTTTSSNKSPAVTMGISTDDAFVTPSIKARPSFRDDIISNGTSTGSYDGNLDTRVLNVSFNIGKNQSNDGVNFSDSVSVTSPLINTGNALFNNITLYVTTVPINATKHMNPTVPDVTTDNKKYNSTTTTTSTSSNKSPAVTMGISTDDALVTQSMVTPNTPGLSRSTIIRELLSKNISVCIGCNSTEAVGVTDRTITNATVAANINYTNTVPSNKVTNITVTPSVPVDDSKVVENRTQFEKISEDGNGSSVETITHGKRSHISNINNTRYTTDSITDHVKDQGVSIQGAKTLLITTTTTNTTTINIVATYNGSNASVSTGSSTPSSNGGLNYQVDATVTQTPITISGDDYAITRHYDILSSTIDGRYVSTDAQNRTRLDQNTSVDSGFVISSTVKQPTMDQTFLGIAVTRAYANTTTVSHSNSTYNTGSTPINTVDAAYITNTIFSSMSDSIPNTDDATSDTNVKSVSTSINSLSSTNVSNVNAVTHSFIDLKTDGSIATSFRIYENTTSVWVTQHDDLGKTLGGAGVLKDESNGNISQLLSKLHRNSSKEAIGVTVVIDIKSAGSGWVKIPIRETSPVLKGVEVGIHRMSTNSTNSKTASTKLLTSALSTKLNGTVSMTDNDSPLVSTVTSVHKQTLFPPVVVTNSKPIFATSIITHPMMLTSSKVPSNNSLLVPISQQAITTTAASPTVIIPAHSTGEILTVPKTATTKLNTGYSETTSEFNMVMTVTLPNSSVLVLTDSPPMLTPAQSHMTSAHIDTTSYIEDSPSTMVHSASMRTKSIDRTMAEAPMSTQTITTMAPFTKSPLQKSTSNKSLSTNTITTTTQAILTLGSSSVQSSPLTLTPTVEKMPQTIITTPYTTLYTTTTTPLLPITNTTLFSLASNTASTSPVTSTALPSTSGSTVTAVPTSTSSSSSSTTTTTSSTTASTTASTTVTATTSTVTTTTTPLPTTTEMTVLNISGFSGALYEPASVVCTVVGPMLWNQIYIYFENEKTGNSKILSTFKRASLATKRVSDRYKTTLSIRGKVSRAKMVIGKFHCDDQGVYTCILDNGLLQETRTLYAKTLTPDLPKIIVNDFIERQSTRLSCSGVVPYPNGDLDWQLNGRRLRRGTKMTVESTVSNCTKLLTKTFRGRFNRRLNGSKLTCFEKDNPERFSSIKVLIVPSNFCEGRGVNKVVSHPFSCNKYITCLNGYFLTGHCPGNLCYNADSERCDTTQEPKVNGVETNKFSCSGKSTGHVIPNQDECAGYYLCVAGLKQIRSCPIGTYFSLTIPGLCTFDYNHSYCASIGKELSNR